MHKVIDFSRFSHRTKIFFFLLIIIGMTLSVFVPVSAATAIVVNDTGDIKKSNDGVCTLREAVIAANSDKPSGNRNGECLAGNGADTIFLPAGTYTLTRTDNGKEDAATTGDLDLLEDVTIVGAGADVTIVDGSALTDRVVHAIHGNATISGVTLYGGTASENGGGIFNDTNLTLTAVSLTNNHTNQNGGGIYNSATATLTMQDSTIHNNSAAGDGGGFYNAGGTAVLANSTLSGNNGTGFVSLSNTELTNVTIADDAEGNFTAVNTIFAGNCTGTLNSGGYNLISHPNCVINGSTTGNIVGVPAQLDTLGDNGGPTLTHALLPNSPPIETGTNTICPAADQRGIARPIGAFCDIGAFEFENPPQIGPVIAVNTNDDTNDGACTYEHCSLREAINAANDSTTITAVTFAIPNATTPTITLNAPLPTLTAPITLDGTTQTGGLVILDGSQAGPGANGLTITAGDTAVHGLHITQFDGDGIRISDNGNNLISGNLIDYNNGNGITIIDSTGNQISSNNIHDNGGLSIDLGGDGRTDNDTNDNDIGANFVQNYPVLLAAVSNTNLTITGYLNSQPSTAYTLEFFAGASCPLFGGGPQTALGTTTITTSADGSVYFSSDALPAVVDGNFVTATATDTAGNTSEFSSCIVVGPNNTSWPAAQPVTVTGDLTPTAVSQYLDRAGQSRWYKFAVQPNSKIIVTLTDLPANYDLTIYRDIGTTYESLTSPQNNADLALLGAEFAPEAFTPEAFTPEAFSPEAFTPEAFTPEAFTPEAFTASVFSPEAFTPEAFTASAFSPEAFTPEAFTPEAFTPEAFTPEAFTPEAFTPEAFTPEAFTGAQLRSLLGVSAFRGTASEGLIVNTWNQMGAFYVRVRGANGAFDQQSPFQLQISMLSGQCGDVAPISTASSHQPDANGYKTIILADMNRIVGTPAEKAAMLTKLNDFATQPEVSGVIVNVGGDARVAAANVQADSYPACPYAKNLLADTVKELIDGYQALNPLQYVVIVGNDGVIPFYRYPDNALLANESNYIPPVLDGSPSQASLRLGYVLGQDAYGTNTAVSFKNSSIPIPQLGVGRLVETAVEVSTMLDAYLLGTNNGLTNLTTLPLVTGYDFLEDAALAVQNELESGTGFTADTLIAPQDVAPTDPASWTAADLRDVLLNGRHDLIFLAGHFSASGALAADYSTRLTAAELAAANVNLNNAIIFSAGCHAGYNVVDADGVPFVTESPDWAQAFARQGATFIGGTGYQYGDTEFLEYSERLYLEFSQALRSGDGAVTVGRALVAAKQTYLADTPQMRGIHQKALIEATLFGFPMLAVDMPGARLTPPADSSIVTGVTAVTSNPGQTFGLTYADVTITPQLTQQTKALENITDGSTIYATYFEGADGVFTSPAEPTLPLEIVNVDVPDTVLRGVGFRGGSYTDLQNILPLTGAPTTEIRGVHAPFLVDYHYPIQLWRPNYFATLTDGGATRLALTPAQFKSTFPGSATGTMRLYDDVDLRLFYNNNIASYGTAASTPALSAPPTIEVVTAVATNSTIEFALTVTGNPAVGVQEVWVTYTTLSGSNAGQWQSLDLSQSEEISTLWTGSLPLNGTIPNDIRFLAQAVNGVGLVGFAANLGDLYTVATEGPPPLPTTLNLDILTPNKTAPYGTQATFRATLTSGGEPVANETIIFGLGLQTRRATTDANGEAVLSMTLLGLPDLYAVQASFAGTAVYAPTNDNDTFTITKQSTALTLVQPASGYTDDHALLTATLADASGRRLTEKSVFFVLSGTETALSRAVITDYSGTAVLGDLSGLPPGEYGVNIYFNGTIPLHTGATLTLADPRYDASSSSGTLTILNTTPTASDDTYTTAEDTALTVTTANGVLANDADLNGSPLTAVLTTSPQHGTITLNSDGSFTYTPDTNFNGTDSFGYVAHDGLDNSTEAAVIITVTPVNDAPVATPDTYSMDQDSILIVAAPGVLANDSDVDGDGLTAVLDTPPVNGTLTLNGNGSFTYIPDPGFYGADSFTYTAVDGQLNSQPAVVSITVNQVNTAPICNGAYSSVTTIWPLNKNLIPVNVLGITDADGDIVTITITAIFQDEPTGKSPDGFGIGTDTALVRAERDGSGDGRVYHIFFIAADGQGATCTGELLLPTVAHDQSYDLAAMDGGALYDSTIADPK